VAEQGEYLYAVARGVGPTALTDTRGLHDQPLRVLEHRGLAAVLSAVDLDEFGEEGLRRNLEDLTWLEAVARGHDAVVQQVARTGAVAPMRLATIFTSDDGVRARLDELYDALTAALDRVEGRREWSVKVYAPERGAESPAPPSTAPGSGADYLRRKKAQTLEKQTAEDAALQIADTVHDTLAAQCVASRRLRPQDPRLTGHEGTMTLNGAYLVDEASADSFTEVAARLAEENPQSRVEVQGPWPPYSFATLEQP
jgi:hypothetical protein